MPETELVQPKVLKALEKYLEDMGLKNYKIDISQGSILGDNYLGVIAKAVINGVKENGEKCTLNWIIKSAPIAPAFRKLTNVELMYGREIFFYKKVFPAFLKLQEGKKLPRPFKNFTPVYYSSMEECNECLVMENMKERGFIMKNRKEPLDLDHVLLVLKEYGRYHALSFALKDQNPCLFKELAKETHSHFFQTVDRHQMTLHFNNYFDKAVDTLDPIKDGQIIESVRKIQERVFDIFDEILDPDAVQDFGVLAHGDCWLNNMLFKYENEATSPSEVLFLDWQLARISSPFLDLSYFLFTCTEKDLRDKYWETILKEYYQSLSNFLIELGSDPNKLYPYEKFQEHIKIYGKYGFLMALMVLYLMMCDSDEIPDYKEMTQEEMTKAVNFESKHEGEFKRRIKGVVLSCAEYGILN